MTKTRVVKPQQYKENSHKSVGERFLSRLSRWNDRLTDRYQAFLARRPHRSFQRTRRRDYARSLKLPGLLAFTAYVWRTLRKRWRVFLPLVLLYAFVLVIIGAVSSQDIYTQISDLLKESSGDIFGSGLGKVGQAGLLAVSAFTINPNSLSVDQQIYMALSLLFVWLCTVWLLREFLLGRKPRLRDGLYNSGSPVLATLVLCFVLILQLLPLGIVALIYAALSSVGLISDGFGSMLFWVVAAAVALLVGYWITSTWIALVVVTLPGMYPVRALRAAGDLVVSRRLRLMVRWLWALIVLVIGWAVVMIPMILIDTALVSWLSWFKDVPLIPYIGAIATAASVVWFAAYIYLLYRGVVDDDAKPA